MTSTTLNQTLSTINTFEDYEKLKASIEEELAGRLSRNIIS